MVSVIVSACVLPFAEELRRDYISKLYSEGELNSVRILLEDYLKSNPEGSKPDRIFALKHLSVIYAKDAEARSLAQSYIYRLLNLNDSLDIVDLYPSTAIIAFFDSTKSQYVREKSYSSQFDIIGNRRDSADTARPIPSRTTAMTDTALVGPASSAPLAAISPPPGVKAPSGIAAAHSAPVQAESPSADSRSNRLRNRWLAAGAVGAGIIGAVVVYAVTGDEKADPRRVRVPPN